MDANRRSFLKASGTVALLGATGLAGCSGGLLGGGGGGGTDQWQYDPGLLLDTQNKFFGSMDYGTIYQNRESLPASTQESFESVQEGAPVTPEDIDGFTGVGGGQISVSTGETTAFGSGAITGSFDTEAIASDIESQGDAQETGTYEGYTLYEQSSSGSVGMGQSATAMFGVGDSALVFGVVSTQGTSASVTAQQTVETAIDASNGNAEMLRANSDIASELSDAIGDGTVRIGGQVDPALVDQMAGSASSQSQFVNGMRGGGFGMQLNGETSTITAVALYEDAQTAEDTGIVELVEAFGNQAVESNPDINSISPSYDGRTVVVTVEGQTQALFEQGTGSVPGGGIGPGTSGF
jgi:hypothetical protein